MKTVFTPSPSPFPPFFGASQQQRSTTHSCLRTSPADKADSAHRSLATRLRLLPARASLQPALLQRKHSTPTATSLPLSLSMCVMRQSAAVQ
jgi:hypothetical protein